MSKVKIKRLEKTLSRKLNKLVDAPLFVFKESGGYVLNRSFIENLGYTTKDFNTPKEGGGLYKAGDSKLCLLPNDHELINKDENYIQFKGAIGLTIEI